ncbi:MAG: hypothetical protein IJM59_08610 [Proteobacteria bacterium]|nr:hypothetical protein [Pseudomonadota bacterium]
MEQTVLIVGCQTSAQNVLISALKRAGLNAFGDTYDAIITNVNVPNGLILYVDAQNIRQAKAFLSQPALACTNKILVIDPRDLAARQLSATIDIDDVIFKPIRLKELISRLKLILERGYSERTSNTAFCDEIDFAQKLENFGTTQFSGALFLKGQNSNAELYFENGLVKGIRIGQKIQKNAIDAIWRVFPAKQRTIAKIEFPEWVAAYPVTYDIRHVVDQAFQAAALFDEKFKDIKGLQSIFKVNNKQYEKSYRSLPRQVRQIIQDFDGTRTLENIFNILNLDEQLIIQIIRRLIDESLIVECTDAQHLEDISLAEWIRGTNDHKEPSEIHSIPDRLQLEEEATPSFSSFVTEDTVRLKAPEAHEDSETPSSQQPEQAPEEDAEDTAVISKDTVSGALSEESFFECHEPKRKHFDRQTVEEHLAKKHSPLITSENKLRKNLIYSEETLAMERARDEELEARLQAEDEAILNLSVDDSEWSEEHQDTPQKAYSPDQNKAVSVQSGETGSVPDNYKDRSLIADDDFSPVDLYKKNHSGEMSPAEWHAATLARLEAETKERSNKLIKKLIIVAIIAIILLIAVFIARFSGVFSRQTPLQPTTVAENTNAPANITENPAGTTENPADTTENPAGTAENPADNSDDPGVKESPLPSEPEQYANNTDFPDNNDEINDMADGINFDDDDVDMDDGSDNEDTDESEITHPQVNAPQAQQLEANGNPVQPQADPESHSHRSSRRNAAEATDDSNAKKSHHSENHGHKKTNVNEQLKSVREAINKKDLAAAQSLLTPLLEQNSSDPNVLTVATQLASMQGDFTKALKYSKMMESTNSNKASYWKQRARLHRTLGEMTESDECIDKAIALMDPASAEVETLKRSKFNP